jgi:hypothetical protein
MLKKNSNCYNASGSSPTLVLSLRPRGLRPPAAAAYLGVTSFQIEELMRSGDLPFRIIGGARVIAVEDLDKYFDSVTTQSGKLVGRGIHIAKVTA